MRLVIAGPATLSQSPLLLPDAPAEPYSPSKIGPGFKPSSSYTCSIFFLNRRNQAQIRTVIKHLGCTYFIVPLMKAISVTIHTSVLI